MVNFLRGELGPNFRRFRRIVFIFAQKGMIPDFIAGCLPVPHVYRLLVQPRFPFQPQLASAPLVDTHPRWPGQNGKQSAAMGDFSPCLVLLPTANIAKKRPEAGQSCPYWSPRNALRTRIFRRSTYKRSLAASVPGVWHRPPIG
jgi:hypothetical protein